MEKVSVLIPVYNGEKYLRQCVESVFRQVYQNLEIIIINDGSTDKTALICEQLRQEDARVRVLHKPFNEGLGAGRNSSLAMATGDYIVFVDSDDWIDPTHISDLHDLMKRTDSDIAIANFTRYDENESLYQHHITDQDYYEKIYSPQEWFAFQYGQGHNLSLCFTVAWCKLYKRSLFDTVQYYSGGFGEDDRTTWKLYLMADKIAYMHRSSYVYRANEKSMTEVAESSTIFSVEPIAERLEVLGLIGFDLSREIDAYQWRAQINRENSLEKGNIKAYKELEFRRRIMEKYRK